jgi:hypothetical protein
MLEAMKHMLPLWEEVLPEPPPGSFERAGKVIAAALDG